MFGLGYRSQVMVTGQIYLVVSLYVALNFFEIFLRLGSILLHLLSISLELYGYQLNDRLICVLALYSKKILTKEFHQRLELGILLSSKDLHLSGCSKLVILSNLNCHYSLRYYLSA